MAEIYEGERSAGAAGAPWWAALAIAVVAVAAAWAGHWIARSVSLVALLPAAQGVAVGAAAGWAITRFGFAHPRAAWWMAAAGAALAVLGHAALDFRHTRGERAARCAELYDLGFADSPEPQPGAELGACVPFELSSFARLRFGIGAGASLEEGRGVWLGTRGAIGLAAVELLVAIWIAGGLARRAAREPMCSSCHRWRAEQVLGRMRHGNAARLVEGLLTGDLDGARSALEPPDTREEVLLALVACQDGHDRGGGILRIAEHRVERGGRRWLGAWRRRGLNATLIHRHLCDLRVSADEVALLREQLDV